MKRLLIIFGIIVAVVFVAILLIPLFINVDSFRPEVEKQLSEALGRQVRIGKISASILSGGAEADNISISDDPAFSQQPFLKASSLRIGLEMMPLIFSREFKVTALTIKDPDIQLLENSAGKWNYSSLGNSAQSKAVRTEKQGSRSSTNAADFSVDKFEIQNGKIQVGQTISHSAAREHSFEKVNLRATNISVQSAIPFSFSAATPGGGSMELEGQAGPLNQRDSARTPLDAKVTLRHADLAAIGFAGSALGGIVDFDGRLKSDGQHVVSSGKAKASSLRFVKGGTAAKPAVTLDYSSDYALESNTGTVKAGVHISNSTATANGTLSARGQNTMAHVKVEGHNMAVNDVEGLLPAFGVTLPSGASLQGGSINMTLDAEGPLDALVITGPVSISQTHLMGFDLTSKLGTIAAFTGIKPANDTLIQTFSSNLRVAPEGIHADNTLLDVPSMGQLTGAGTISNSQQLDFKMLLKLVNGGGELGQLTNVTSSVQNKGIPFIIEGTTSNPKFRPTAAGLLGIFADTAGTSQSQPEQNQGLGSILNGLLKKKKSPQ
jgi:AsmA protein